MKHEYVINVTKTGIQDLDGKWVAVFTSDTTSNGKYVTFCSIRKYKECGTPFAGCSVKHPKDEPDDYRGLHNSFKRAVRAMLLDYKDTNFLSYVVYDENVKVAQSRFMVAFWIAMGRPGYKKPMELLPKETLAKLLGE